MELKLNRFSKENFNNLVNKITETNHAKPLFGGRLILFGKKDFWDNIFKVIAEDITKNRP